MHQIHVLGGCGAWPEAGRASSGFLVDHDGFRVVLDLGYATLPRLLALQPDGAVDAVVVTHEHPDHCVDVHALYRVRHYGPAGRTDCSAPGSLRSSDPAGPAMLTHPSPRGRTDCSAPGSLHSSDPAGPAMLTHPSPRGNRIRLYCPLGVPERLGALAPRDDLRDVFDIQPLPGSYRVGPFRLDTWMLPHHVPNAGVRLTAPGLVIAYTGDTGPDPALAELGADADLFVVDATGQGDPPPDAGHLNLTASEAGEWAARARARRLMLTHFWPGSDREVSRAEAARHYPGQILLAEENLLVELP